MIKNSLQFPMHTRQCGSLQLPLIPTSVFWPALTASLPCHPGSFSSASGRVPSPSGLPASCSQAPSSNTMPLFKEYNLIITFFLWRIRSKLYYFNLRSWVASCLCKEGHCCLILEWEVCRGAKGLDEDLLLTYSCCLASQQLGWGRITGRAWETNISEHLCTFRGFSSVFP